MLSPSFVTSLRVDSVIVHLSYSTVGFVCNLLLIVIAVTVGLKNQFPVPCRVHTIRSEFMNIRHTFEVANEVRSCLRRPYRMTTHLLPCREEGTPELDPGGDSVAGVALVVVVACLLEAEEFPVHPHGMGWIEAHNRAYFSRKKNARRVMLAPSAMPTRGQGTRAALDEALKPLTRRTRLRVLRMYLQGL